MSLRPGGNYALPKQSQDTIETVTGTDQHLQCPWISYTDPLIMSLQKLVSKVEKIPNYDVCDEFNILFEAYLYYKSCENKTKNWIVEQENNYLKEKRKKSKSIY